MNATRPRYFWRGHGEARGEGWPAGSSPGPSATINRSTARPHLVRGYAGVPMKALAVRAAGDRTTNYAYRGAADPGRAAALTCCPTVMAGAVPDQPAERTTRNRCPGAPAWAAKAKRAMRLRASSFQDVP